MRSRSFYWIACFFFCLLFSCKDKKPDITPTPPGPNDSTDVPTPVPFDINNLSDTYAPIANPDLSAKWGPYNVHDPSIIKEGEYYYCYSTDVAYGFAVRPGLQWRKSKDLVDWQFGGWVFPVLPFKGVEYIKSKGGEPVNGLWAPYVVKVGDKFRLYYSLSSSTFLLSCIGLATSSSPEGPWNEVGLVVTSFDNGTVQTNAIDPTVIIDQAGDHWMYYGSAFDGIHMLKLNATTGLAATPGDQGVRVAQRGFTGNLINGNIEGPEIIYNGDFNKYYLFISYDWLETKYNVRVGRADSPQGPFLDFMGNDINEAVDHGPMILAPYRFGSHQGWQGTGHCSVFSSAGRFYMAHQGRPAENYFFMVLHVRQIFWRSDGWPVVSPERYAGIENEPVTSEMLVGNWDRILFHYTVVPGFSNEQRFPDIQSSTTMTLDASGSISGNVADSWTFEYPKLTLHWENGSVEELIVHRGRDWENKVTSTVLFTGMDQEGKAVWGRK